MNFVSGSFIVANNTLVVGDGGNASYIELPLVPLASLPHVDIKSATDAHLLKLAHGDQTNADRLRQSIMRYGEQQLLAH